MNTLLNFGWIAPLLIALQACMALALSFAVFTDANKRRQEGAFLFLKDPWLWFFSTLLSGGYVAAVVYWLMHYSSIRGEQR